MIGSLFMGSPGLGWSLREALSAGAETGEIGSGVGGEGTSGGHSGQGCRLLPGCPSCPGGGVPAPGFTLSGEPASCSSLPSFRVGRASFWLLIEFSETCVPLHSGVDGGSGLHGSISLSSLLSLPGSATKSTAMSLPSISGCRDG